MLGDFFFVRLTPGHLRSAVSRSSVSQFIRDRATVAQTSCFDIVALTVTTSTSVVDTRLRKSWGGAGHIHECNSGISVATDDSASVRVSKPDFNRGIIKVNL